MTPQTKKIVLITSGIVLVCGITYGIYVFTKKRPAKNEADTAGRSNRNPYYTTGSGSAGSSSSSSNTSTSNTTPPEIENINMVNPKFNEENELSNGYLQVKNHVLYPKRKEHGGWGYANIRSSTEVNTDQGWWDPSDNLITTINSGIPIGKVIGETSAIFNDYSYRWFKVKLNKPILGFWSDTTEGYVRADTVTFKPYEK